MNNPLIKALLPSSLLKARQLINITLVVMAMLLSPVSVVAAQLVDINNADAETMIENWKGIGETKARAIVAYRKKNGPFSDINDLANVKGIGEGLIKNNRKYMSLSKGLSKPSGKSNSKTAAQAPNKSPPGKNLLKSRAPLKNQPAKNRLARSQLARRNPKVKNARKVQLTRTAKQRKRAARKNLLLKRSKTSRRRDAPQHVLSTLHRLRF